MFNLSTRYGVGITRSSTGTTHESPTAVPNP